MKVRRVGDSDLPVIAEMMHQALEPFYGGDHRAHAKRIVETSVNGSLDAKGHFSASQVMYVAEDEGQIVGILNFVVKHQGTLKISPLESNYNEQDESGGRKWQPRIYGTKT